jgi:hypothetical protein
VIACVTDNAAEKIKTDLQGQFTNLLPIRCCLHVLNCMVKDIAAQNEDMLVKFRKLVNFFKYGQWGHKAQAWGKEHGEVRLSTFCETRWYASLLCRSKQPGTHWPKSAKVLLHTSTSF